MESQKQTTIIRAPRDKEHPYFSLRRKTAQDTRLSFEARGALAYLLSRPGNWDINLADLQREGDCGRDRALRILKELETFGYLLREKQTFGDKHRFNPVVLVVQEVPHPENPVTDSVVPSTENPITDDPITGGPITENPTHTEYRESQKDGTGGSPAGVDQTTEDEKTEESSTTTGSESLAPVGADEVPPVDVVVDGEADQTDPDRAAWDFIRADIAALDLSADMEKALRALGPAPALAIAMAVDKPGVKSPSGLAVSLIKNPDNIAPALLDRAVEQLVRFAEQSPPAPPPTLEERCADHAQFQAESRRILDERTAGVDESGAQNDTLPTPPGEHPDDGLDFQPPGKSITLGEIWQAVITSVPTLMGKQSIQLYRGTRATCYADGVLTVQAPSPLARDLLNRDHASWGLEVAKWAGMPVEVRAVWTS